MPPYLCPCRIESTGEQLHGVGVVRVAVAFLRPIPHRWNNARGSREFRELDRCCGLFHGQCSLAYAVA
jgi:hypothetical protein